MHALAVQHKLNLKHGTGFRIKIKKWGGRSPSRKEKVPAPQRDRDFKVVSPPEIRWRRALYRTSTPRPECSATGAEFFGRHGITATPATARCFWTAPRPPNIAWRAKQEGPRNRSP